jgi:tRNA dimethylallyltransferase
VNADLNLITVTGPTASGKTSFAAHLASEIDGEIISADSRQVYRKMDIGTGKDLDDYHVGKITIPYHLIDIHEPGYQYNVYEYQKDFFKVYYQIIARSKIPVLAGGTGLYIESILNQYQLIQVPVNESLREELESRPLEELVEILKKANPELHNSTDTKHKKRTVRAIEIARHCSEHKSENVLYPRIHSLLFGVKYDRASQRRRISERLRARMDGGMIDEVKELLEYLKPEDLIYYGLEYKYLTMHLTGELTLDETFSKLETAIHQFAKRQMTWFRRMEKQGHKIHWIDGHMPMDQKLDRARSVLNNYSFNL